MWRRPSSRYVPSCADDDVLLNPFITIASPQAGRYELWVGSYLEGLEFEADAQVYTRLPGLRV